MDQICCRCFGAASAKERLDVVIRDAINAGEIPGPRYLANGKELARRDGTLVAGITAAADGPDEMREVIRHHVDLGVDSVKLSMSGEEVSYAATCMKQITDFQTDHRNPRSSRLLFYRRGDGCMRGRSACTWQAALCSCSRQRLRDDV